MLIARGCWDVPAARTDARDGQDTSTRVEWDSPATSHCCLGLNIPKPAWTTALMPVLAQARDTENYWALDRWIRANVRRAEHGKVWTEEGVEWSIGNTANYALGVATREHPHYLRSLHGGYMRCGSAAKG